MPEPILRIAGDDARSLPKKINLTKTAIEQAATPPGKDRIVIYDAKVPGLALRVAGKGAETSSCIASSGASQSRCCWGSSPTSPWSWHDSLRSRKMRRWYRGSTPARIVDPSAHQSPSASCLTGTRRSTRKCGTPRVPASPTRADSKRALRCGTRGKLRPFARRT